MLLPCRFLLLLPAFASLTPCSFPQQIQVSKDNRTVAITATATAKAEADSARVHIGFVSYAPSAAQAYAQASATSRAIVDSLTKAGFPKAAIESQTQGIAETERYEMQFFTPEERQQDKLTVQQTWLVQTTAKDAPAVLNLAVNAGANKSGEIDWTVADENALEADAAGNALSHARQIANEIAKGLGTPLGALMYASNEAPSAAVPLVRATAGVVGGIVGGVGTVPLAIRPQQVTRSATVYAVFALQ
jgi:uncharacterized protein YggE